MLDIYIHIHPISYEDCGLLGGRSAFAAGTELHNMRGKSRVDFIEEVLHLLIRKSKYGRFIYPFKRIAVCFIDLDGAVSVAYTGDDDIENNAYSYIDSKGRTGRIFRYYDIGEMLCKRNIQVYGIFQQQDDDTYRAIGNISCDRDSGESGSPEIMWHDKELIRGIDVVRCLDLRGSCKAKVVEAAAFHNYVKYDLGEDFFIEGYDNFNTGSREYWVGRDYTKEKFLLNCYELNEEGREEIVSSDWKISIDQRFAEMLCKLTDRYEYIFIDNDYRISMAGINIEKIKEKL